MIERIRNLEQSHGSQPGVEVNVPESFWFSLEGGRVREGAREKLLEVVQVAREAARVEYARGGEQDDRAAELLASSVGACAYLRDASPSFRRHSERANVEFPFILQALSVADGGEVTIDQGGWVCAYDMDAFAATLSDFLEPGALIYSEADREGEFYEGLEVTGTAALSPLRLGWVRADNTLALAL